MTKCAYALSQQQPLPCLFLPLRAREELFALRTQPLPEQQWQGKDELRQLSEDICSKLIKTTKTKELDKSRTRFPLSQICPSE